MKILYFGTVCNSDTYNEIINRSRVKPSVASLVFENALMNGFAENDADIEVFSFPSIPAYPKSKTLFIKGIKNTLDCGTKSSWIPAINISGIKQITQRLSSSHMLRKWLKKNRNEEKAVLIYSIYQPIAKSIVTECRKFDVPCFAIVPDLPRDMYANARISPFKKFLTSFYTNAVRKIQGNFDGYIYLAEQMKEIINPVAPYIVVEGIASYFDIKNYSKSDYPSVMYAGALNEKLGIKNLVEAFMKIKDENIRLWLFGSGDCESFIISSAKKDSRIKFFGFKNRNEILEFEQKAHLLLNIRNPEEEYTKFSFPSKTIEYMLSCTPLLTSKLSGIPNEYFDYCFTIDNMSPDAICDKITEILSLSQEELQSIGVKARNFIIENKSEKVQSKKILNFIEENI